MVLPICPFGNIEWWSLALQCETIQLNCFENFQKQTWRNRYDILGANGVQKLSIPISRPSGIKLKTTEISIFNEDDWKKIHWRSIKSAYGSSPFWIYYSEELESIFTKKHISLKNFCLESIQFILNELQLENKLIYVTQAPDLASFTHLSFKPSKSTFKSVKYQQVFSDRSVFKQNLSVLDLLFNLGPQTEEFLLQQKNTEKTA